MNEGAQSETISEVEPAVDPVHHETIDVDHDHHSEEDHSHEIDHTHDTKFLEKHEQTTNTPAAAKVKVFIFETNSPQPVSTCHPWVAFALCIIVVGVVVVAILLGVFLTPVDQEGS